MLEAFADIQSDAVAGFLSLCGEARLVPRCGRSLGSGSWFRHRRWRRFFGSISLTCEYNPGSQRYQWQFLHLNEYLWTELFARRNLFSQGLAVRLFTATATLSPE